MIPKVLADFETELNKAGDVPGIKFVAGSYIGDIISELLKYVFPLSGLLLLFFLISGGFDLMTSGGDPKKTEQAKEKLTSALTGFVIVFTAFWIYQLVKYVFGIQ